MKTELKDKKLLVIVESPSKATHIKEYLKKAGYNVTVMASVGHIMHLANSGDCYNTGIDPAKDFEMDLQVSDDKVAIVKKLKEAVKNADLVYTMSDPDREGEVISWSLVQFLKIPKTKCFRAVTHEITPKAVVDAIENPVKFDDNLVAAGLTRMSIDKLIGFGLTSDAKVHVGAKSVGRCQSVGLKLVVDREREIQDFVPTTYYDLFLNFVKNETPFKAKYDHERITDKAIINKIIAECKGDFKIADIARREKQESPKPPFCTATFQQEAASKLGLSVKDAMSIAQKLFENGYITYHRSDSTELSAEFIPELKNYITKTYGTFVEPRKAKSKETDQLGHEGVRITDPNMTPDTAKDLGLNDFQYKVYRLIWQRTIASALPNACISETKYIIENNGHRFVLVSNEVIDEGYRKVYAYKDKDAEDEKFVKETFVKDEILQDCKLESVTKSTNPPPRFTEASLVQKLKDLEIGRPSTFATIVETVLNQSRGYAELQDKKIVPTQKGIQLANYLDKAYPNLISLNYTKEMEEQLDKIAAGKMTKLECMTSFYTNLKESIDKNKSQHNIPTDTKPCPECGRPMIIRRSRYGNLFYGCSGYPKCKHCENIK